MQRNARFKSMYKNNIKWFDTVYKDEVKMARGVQQFMLLYHVQRTRRLREEILKQEYAKIDALKRQKKTGLQDV